MLNHPAQVIKDIWDIARLIATIEKSSPAEVVLSILIAYYKMNYGSHPLVESIIRRRKSEEASLEVIA